MKQLFRGLLLCGALMTLLCVGALAAEPTESGIYGIAGSGAALTPQKADWTAVTASTQGSYTDYYASAVRFKAEATGLTAGSQYLLLVVEGTGTVPTASNIVYIDQKAADSSGTVTFNAYPGSLATSTYSVYLVGSGKAFSAASPAATFSYYQAYTPGDVDDDGEFTATDSLYTLQMAVGIKAGTEIERLAANVDGDQNITATDALFILQRAVGLRESF